MSTALNPIRTLAKQLLRRFLDRIELECERSEGDIPNIAMGQWRTISAVLATHRAMADEEFQKQEAELAKLDYSKLSIKELKYLQVRFKEHPEMAATNGDPIIDIPDNGGAP